MDWDPKPPPPAAGVSLFPEPGSFPRQSVNIRSAKLFTASGHTPCPELDKSTQAGSYSILGAATTSWIIVDAVAGTQEPSRRGRTSRKAPGLPRAAGCRAGHGQCALALSNHKSVPAPQLWEMGAFCCDDGKTSPPLQEKGAGSALLPTRDPPLFKDQP